MNTKIKNKAVLMVAVLAMIVASFAITASPDIQQADAAVKTVDSGTCGTNLSWNLDSAGVLSITGTGAMTDYSEVVGQEAPWSWSYMPVFTVNIGSGVTTIGDYAFYNTYLKTITIPDSIEKIGKYSISNNSLLVEVVYGSNPSLTMIDDWAFSGNSLLTAIELPSSLTSLGDCVFSGCTMLKTITENSSNFSFDDGILYTVNGSTPTEVVCVPSGLKKTSVSIPATITSIHGGAFADNLLMDTIDLSGCSGLTEIGKYAFSNCTSLRSVTLPDNLGKIADYAFKDCCSLGSFTFPEQLEDLGDCVFLNCSNLETIDLGDNSTFSKDQETGIITTGSGQNKSIVLVSKYFSGSNGTLTYTIPSDVRYVYGGAFQYCKNLKSIAIGGSTQVGEYAFSECYGLTGFEIPSSWTIIPKGAFMNTGLTSITIPAAITKISPQSFDGCSSLASITIDDNSHLKIIGDRAFAGSVFSSITLPDELVSIGNSAFYNNVKITDVTLPHSVKALGNLAFANGRAAVNIKYLDLGSLEMIGNIPFATKTTVEIPSTLQKIRQNAFAYASGSINISDDTSLKVVNTEYGNFLVDSNECCLFKLLTSNVTEIHVPEGISVLSGRSLGGHAEVTTLSLPDSVVMFAESSLRDMTSLTSMNMPSYLKIMAAQCLQNETALSGTINIPDSVMSIGYMALYNSTSISGISFTNDSQLLVLDTNSIYGTSITALSLPSNLRHISPDAFHGVSLGSITLQSETYYKMDTSGILYDADLDTIVFSIGFDQSALTIDSGVMEIYNGAFEGNTTIESLTVPSNVKVIGSRAFANCSSLTSLILAPDRTTPGVYQIGSSAFSGCDIKTSLLLPYTLKTLGGGAFDNNANLESVDIPNSIITEGDAFLGCTKLVEKNYYGEGYYVVEGNLTYNANKTVLIRCNDSAEEYQVGLAAGLETISDWSFYNCTHMTAVTIPDSVTSIGEYAFSGCTSLETVTIPDSVTDIGGYAFERSGITTMTLPTSVTSLKTGTFKDCAQLTYVEVPNASVIYAYVFLGCTSLNEAKFTYYGVNFAGSDIFDSGNTTLTKLTVPAMIKNDSKLNALTGLTDLTFVGDGPMYNVGSYSKFFTYYSRNTLENVTISSGVTSIGNRTFMYCEKVKSIDIPESIISIGNCAFFEAGLTSIAIPDSVTNIGSQAFMHCYSLTTVSFKGDPKVTVLDQTFKDTALTSIDIPDSVTSLVQTFWRCDSLTSVNISPNSNLTSITWPFNSTDGYSGTFYIPSKVVETSNALASCVGGTIEFAVTDLTSPNWGGPQPNTLIIPINANYAGTLNFWSLENLVITGNDAYGVDYTSSNYTNLPWYKSRATLKSITFQDGIKSIGDYMFYGCTGTGIASIILPKSVVSIGEYAFCGCNNLVSMTVMMPGAPTMGTNCLDVGYGNNSKVTLNLSGMTWVTSYDFSGKYVEANTTIVASAVAGESCGTNVYYYIADKVLYIYGTGTMTDFDHSSDATKAPWSGSSVESAVIYDGVMHIGSDAFYGMNSLDFIVVNGNYVSPVKAQSERSLSGCSIGSGALSGTNLKQIKASVPTGNVTLNKGGYSFIQAGNTITIPSVLWFDSSDNLITLFSAGQEYSPGTWASMVSQSLGYNATATVTLT